MLNTCVGGAGERAAEKVGGVERRATREENEERRGGRARGGRERIGEERERERERAEREQRESTERETRERAGRAQRETESRTR